MNIFHDNNLCFDLFQAEEKNDQSILFQYGASIGRHDYHKALAKFLTEKYRDDVNW